MDSTINLNIKTFAAQYWINRFFIGTVKFYQATLSYFLGGHCRFYPSCSHYAIESFKNHNTKNALKLVLKRLAKCHPFYPNKGYDPVPPKEEMI